MRGRGGGAVLLMYHCSARIWRWTNSFLSDLSMIVALLVVASHAGVFREVVCNISNTRKSVSSDFQTPRSEVMKWCTAEFN